MQKDEIIKKARLEDNEDLYFELKELKGYIKGNGKFKLKPLHESIVAFANREGGRIIIGIKDNGEAEGIGIFDDCGDGKHSGVDIFKGAIVSSTQAKISPRVDLIINHHIKDEYEFLEVVIPKRKGMPHAVIEGEPGRARERLYYIRTSHSKELVSDTQLEWMFSGENSNLEEKHFILNLTTYKDIGGIPLNGFLFVDRFIIQPNGSRGLTDLLHAISEDTFERCKSDNNFKIEVISEVVMYSILQTLEGFSRVVSSDALPLPFPPDDFILNESVKGKENDLFNRFDKRISFPVGSQLSISKGERKVVFNIRNDYIDIELELSFSRWEVGVSGSNPYAWVLLENHGMDGQDYLHDKYESFEFILTSRTSRLFPDIMSKEYYDSYAFSKTLNNRIKEMWDINHYMKEYPHYRKIYSIDHKLDSLINAINDKNK